MLYPSKMPQEVLDLFTRATALLDLLDPEERELVAVSLASPGMTNEPHMLKTLRAFASAIRDHEED